MPRPTTGNGDPEAKAALKRDKLGRIVTSKGRPKGAVWRPETRRRRDILKALGFDASNAGVGRTNGLNALACLLPLAEENIAHAVKNGDPVATTWFLDTFHRNTHNRALPKAIPGYDFSSIDGVVRTGQTVMEMMAGGELTLPQVDKFISICKGYIQLQGVAEVSRLQDLLAELEDAKATGPRDVTQTLPEDQLPAWGRLREAVDKPAQNGHDAPADPEAALRASILE